MNLNLNEQLLLDTKDANICIFIANLASWLRTNIDREKFEHRNIREGKCWSYSTIKDFQNYFNFWSTKNIRTIIKHCQEQGLIEIGNFNKHKYDKTCWYALTDKALEYYPILKEKIKARSIEYPVDTDLPKTAKGFVQNGKPIPENTTHCSNNTITTSVSSSNKQLMQEMIQIYREEFPNNPQPHKTLLSTSLEKVLRGLIKRWPEADPDRKPLTPQSFRKYMQALKVCAPNFALKTYETKAGRQKKNGLETFCRWDNFVKFLEESYS